MGTTAGRRLQEAAHAGVRHLNQFRTIHGKHLRSSVRSFTPPNDPPASLSNPERSRSLQTRGLALRPRMKSRRSCHRRVGPNHPRLLSETSGLTARDKPVLCALMGPGCQPTGRSGTPVQCGVGKGDPLFNQSSWPASFLASRLSAEAAAWVVPTIPSQSPSHRSHRRTT